MAIIILHFAPCLSKNGPIFSPNLKVKYATIKNLKPLVIIHIKTKDIKLKWIIPLEIVRSLKGKGVKPAVTNIPNQAKKPPPVVNLSLKESEYS